MSTRTDTPPWPGFYLERLALALIVAAPYMAIILADQIKFYPPVFGAISWLLLIPGGLIGLVLIANAREVYRCARRHKAGFMLMAFFWGFAILSAMYIAPLPESAWPATMGISAACFLAFWMLLREQNGEETAQAIFRAVACWAPAIVAMPFLMQVSGIGDWNPLSQDRVLGFGNVRRFEGLVLIFCAVMTGRVLMLKRLPSDHSWLLHLLAVLAWTILFWCGGRGSIIAMTLGAAVTAFAVRAPVRGLMLLGVQCIAGALLSLLLWRPYASFSAVHRLLDAKQPGEGASAISSGRTDVWAWTVEKITEQPGLGYGVKQFYAYNPTHSHAHNTALDLIYSYGVLAGSLPIILAACVIGTALLQSCRERIEDVRFAIAMVLSISLSLSGLLTDLVSAPQMLIALAMALAVLSYRTKALRRG